MFKVKQPGIAMYIVICTIRSKTSSAIESKRVVINESASVWAPVTSGAHVPQGSVPGPVLFIMYMNDIDVRVNAKFAADTKIGNSVISDSDRQSLHDDLRKNSA